MKINKLKLLSIAICCLIISLSEAQCAQKVEKNDEPTNNQVRYQNVPVGSILSFVGDSDKVPDGWLLCDGKQYTSKDYPELYEVIKTSWVPLSEQQWVRKANEVHPVKIFHVPELRFHCLDLKDSMIRTYCIINTGKMNKQSKEELREKQEIYAIRGAKIDERIDQYKLLTSSLNFGELNNVFDKIASLNRKYAGSTSISLPNDIHANEILMQIGLARLQWKTEEAHTWTPDRNSIYQEVVSCALRKIKWLIKEDVFESMKLYKELNGCSHPRWEEFSKMCNEDHH